MIHCRYRRTSEKQVLSYLSLKEQNKKSKRDGDIIWRYNGLTASAAEHPYATTSCVSTAVPVDYEYCAGHACYKHFFYEARNQAKTTIQVLVL